jgi:hypothetical protein
MLKSNKDSENLRKKEKFCHRLQNRFSRPANRHEGYVTRASYTKNREHSSALYLMFAAPSTYSAKPTGKKNSGR